MLAFFVEEVLFLALHDHRPIDFLCFNGYDTNKLTLVKHYNTMDRCF